MGIEVEFKKLHHLGLPGERKSISTSTALHLIQYGIAERVLPEPLSSVHPAAPRHPGQAAPRIVNTPPVPRSALKVTALCPTFNRRAYIPTTIALFLAQTLTSSELLIVDDSTESIEDLVPKNNPRIRYIRLVKDLLHPAAYGHDGRMLIGAKRNVACEQARGEFIVHWDDDDWQSPERLEDQVRQLEHARKQVLTYHNILYWNEPQQFACRCFPRKELRAIHGATLAYRRTWWEQHRFPETGGGEDTAFGMEALRLQQLAITDAKEFVVIRAHGNIDESLDARGNTCRTADHMGTPAIPKCARNQIPEAFFLPLLSAVSDTPVAVSDNAPTKDAVIGVIKNYDWTKIRPYVISLERSGFKGDKVMLVENVPAETRSQLLAHDFIVSDFTTPPSVRDEENRDYLTFGRHRFKYALDWLAGKSYRNLIFCDVRDVVFQTDPGAWLENNLSPHKVVAAGEGWVVKYESYNDRWNKKVSPDQYDRLREFEVLCSGTFAGEASHIIGIFESIYALTLASIGTMPDNADQGMFQRVVRNSPYKEVLGVPKMTEGFVATWFPAKSNDPNVICGYGNPVFNEADGTVYTPDGVTPFSIVHQFDRDAKWQAIMEAKYQ
jgi:glycosyltransferase involved in cell wall biosynthesis